MSFLYVCLFSSGHIKVGRSIDPQSRIAQHADRVACVAIEQATDGAVTRQDLRPSDWHKIWPEIATPSKEAA